MIRRDIVLILAVLVGLGVVFALPTAYSYGATLVRVYQTEIALASVKTEDVFTQAKAHHDAGEYQIAIDYYNEILRRSESHDTDVRAYLQAGHTYRYWGKYAESEKMFLAAAALAPKDAWIYTELGKLYRNWNKDDEAEAALLKSVALDPTQENVYSYGLGYLYLQEKRYAESEAMFKKALSIDPRSDLALSGMGDLNRETGHYDVSESYFKKAFAVNPKSEAYLGLAWLYIKQNRFDDAVVPLRAFLANIREKGEVYYALGVAYTGKGDTADARTAFQKSVALNPDNQMFKDALARNESGK